MNFYEKYLKKKTNYLYKLSMKNFCTICNKNFSTKQNYEVHLKSKKHLQIYEKQHLKVNEKHLKVNENKIHKIFTCKYCLLDYSTKRGFVKHTSICLNKKIFELESEIKSLKLENQELKYKYNAESNDYKKLAMTQKGNTNINSSYQIIINQYKDAPNLTLPKDLEIHESLDKYIESGNPHGIINFLDKYYGSQVPPESRSLWCIDATRCKFVLRHNNEWLIDLDANKFRELTFYPLQNMFYEKQKIMNKNKSDFNVIESNKLLSNVHFLGGFVDKKRTNENY